MTARRSRGREVLPLDDGEADMRLLEPLEDDGWEIGLGYPEE